MDNQLQVFTNEEFGSVRVRVYPNNEIEINLEDAARGLGFTQTEEKVSTTSGRKAYTTIRWARVKKHLADFGYEGTVDKETYIPEHVFYRLAMKANNEAAEKFQDWIARRIIPNIRKHGYYALPDATFTLEAENLVKNPAFLRQIADALEAKDAKISEQAEIINELTPKAQYCDTVLNCKDLIPVSKIAQDYGISAISFNRLLQRLSVLYRQGKSWLLRQEYAKLGWAQSKTHNYCDKKGEIHVAWRLYWTQQGRYGLYNLLKQKGFLPTTEKQSNLPEPLQLELAFE